MAKHDQRILKFLNQNADRAPTITDMMTRLSISISDISDSLSSLQGQGLISMKTNAQGIECWYPASSSSLNGPQPTQPVPMPSPVPNPQPPASAPSAWDKRPLVEIMPAVGSRFDEPPPNRPVPEPGTTMPRTFPAPTVQAASSPTSAPQPISPVTQAPPALETGFPQAAGGTQVASYSTGASFSGLSQPAAKSVGIGTFAFGLIAAVGLSAWLGGYMAEKKIEKATSAFADKKSVADAGAAFSTFQVATQSQVAALEMEIKKLSADLTAAKAAADSLKVAVAARPQPVKAVSRKPVRSKSRSASR